MLYPRVRLHFKVFLGMTRFLGRLQVNEKQIPWLLRYEYQLYMTNPRAVARRSQTMLPPLYKDSLEHLPCCRRPTVYDR